MKSRKVQVKICPTKVGEAHFWCRLGDLIITDQCHTSKFGDTRLAFKHQWIEDDAALKPEWAKKYAENCYCNPSS